MYRSKHDELSSISIASDIESRGEEAQALVETCESSGLNAPIVTSDYPADGGCVPCCIYKRRMGNVWILVERKTSDGSLDIKCLAPVCWPMIFVTTGLVLSASFFAMRFTLPNLHWACSIVSFALLAAFVSSLLLTSLRDFGIFPRYHQAMGTNWNWSVQSQSFRPPGVFFCSESKVLVKNIDHFCPWTGTTIGGGNLMSFRCLLTTFWLIVFYFGGLVVYTFNFVDRS